ncbi:hypothetical protein SAMN05444350_105113 [Bacteroides stercorirosoris]|uniref:Uncharacterized protein n=1 Tax=Bacteroides stercorirosoris TaxID=871324 RepID=A0A1M6CZ06_9BACE|nr:hypothetical protein SAMN05444350_105113 [Bacteroides stercorirosoris]
MIITSELLAELVPFCNGYDAPQITQIYTD